MRPEEIVQFARRLFLSTFLSLLLFCPACLSDKVCGDDFVAVDGLCYLPADTQASVTDAGEPDTESGDEPADLPSGMMDPCTSNSDCNGEADYCLQPNYPDLNGNCTTQGCTLDPDNCPEGYLCLDLSVYLGGLPTVCTWPIEGDKFTVANMGGAE